MASVRQNWEKSQLQDQVKQVNALTLVANAIIMWNTWHITVSDDDLARY